MKPSDRIKQLKTQREATQKEIDRVLAKRSTGSRARAAYDLWLKLNPTHEVGFDDGTTEYMYAQDIHKACLDKVKHLRESRANKFGTNESGSMRLGLELPPQAAHFMSLFHPDIFDEDDAAKTRFRKLVKQFPEFQVYKVI